LGRIRVWTEFPFGLFHVWAWLEPDTRLLVYPKPSGKHHLQFSNSATRQGPQNLTRSGHDDYHGNRHYQPGDSPNHIDWKALARRHETLTKQFSEQTGDEIWLDWDLLPMLDAEQRLSQLCQWILDLHRTGRSYGLKLPNERIIPGHGERHKHHCLEKLALFKHS
jgi:uncharacterized protein (DUF58 family)